MDKEYQPNWDYQDHKRKAEDLGEATLDAAARQQALEAKNPLFKHFGYEKDQAEYGQEKLDRVKASYDNQILEAKSRQDLAHEQALLFAAMAEQYKDTAKKLTEEFGIELPEQKMEYFINAVSSDDLVISSPLKGRVLALRDLFIPAQEVEHAQYAHLSTRLPREDLGDNLEEAKQAAELKGAKSLLHIRSGEGTRDDFYHGQYKDKYVPMGDELAELFQHVKPSQLNVRISRYFNSSTHQYTGYPDLITRFDTIDLEEAQKQIEIDKLPISAEVHYMPRGGRSYDDRKVNVLKGGTTEEIKQEVLELILDQGVVTGSVTVDGSEVPLREFLLGKKDAEEVVEEVA